MRCLAAIAFSVGIALSLAQDDASAQEGLIDLAVFDSVGHTDQTWDGGDPYRYPGGVMTTPPDQGVESYVVGGSPSDGDLSWLGNVRVGYDKGFVIASQQDQGLGTSDFPFRLQLNGWGQLRYTVSDMAPPNTDLNQFQLKRRGWCFQATRSTRTSPTLSNSTVAAAAATPCDCWITTSVTISATTNLV